MKSALYVDCRSMKLKISRWKLAMLKITTYFQESSCHWIEIGKLCKYLTSLAKYYLNFVTNWWYKTSLKCSANHNAEERKFPNQAKLASLLWNSLWKPAFVTTATLVVENWCLVVQVREVQVQGWWPAHHVLHCTFLYEIRFVSTQRSYSNVKPRWILDFAW